MSDEDKVPPDLFTQAMQQVDPIQRNDKINPVNTPLKRNSHAIVRHISESKEYTFQADKPSKLHTGASPWVLCANGISPDILKKLASGQPRPCQNLDLHGMTRDKAIQALQKAMQMMVQTGTRVIAVIHGRGLHSRNSQPVLKHSIYQWLKSGAMCHHILAVIPSPASAGGSCLILLRRDKHK
ncbi:MAG: Smr/MutS family protein [Mariprofundaceae bacterium]|nr:Smr/MutS family protein [Mariprofundaceae bacterium]